MEIRKIINILKSLITRNKIKYYKTNIINGKQSFAIKFNEQIIIMQGKIEKMNGFDFPYEAKELNVDEEETRWEKIKKNVFDKEYKGSNDTIKTLIKTLKKELKK